MLHIANKTDLQAIEGHILAALARGPIQADTLGNTSQPAPLWLVALFEMTRTGKIVLYVHGGMRRERLYATLPQNFPAGLTCHGMIGADDVVRKLSYTLTSYEAISEARNQPPPPPDARTQAANEAAAEAVKVRRAREVMAIVNEVTQRWSHHLSYAVQAIKGRQPLKPEGDELERYFAHENSILVQRRRHELEAALYKSHLFGGRTPVPTEILDQYAPVGPDIVLIRP